MKKKKKLLASSAIIFAALGLPSTSWSMENDKTQKNNFYPNVGLRMKTHSPIVTINLNLNLKLNAEKRELDKYHRRWIAECDVILNDWEQKKEKDPIHHMNWGRKYVPIQAAKDQQQYHFQELSKNLF